VLARRDLRSKESVPIEGAVRAADDLLEEIQQSLFDRASGFREEHTSYPSTFEELEEGVREEGGFFHAAWCGSPDCEAQVQHRTQATIRNIPFDQPDELAPCVFCGAPGEHLAVFAKAY
jgi:prolyl-tRNA synthetase